jgi:hypothetical protein
MLIPVLPDGARRDRLGVSAQVAHAGAHLQKHDINPSICYYLTMPDWSIVVLVAANNHWDLARL